MRKIGAVVAAAVAVLTATAVVWEQARERGEGRSVRKISARLVGEEHAPHRVLRGSSSGDEVELAKSLSAEPRERGRALLRTGDTRAATADLREAARDDDPAALTDLAAALVTRGQDVEAVAVATRALAREPDLAAARFNLALALEQLGFTTEARAAMLEVARLEGDSGWGKEARARAEDLRRLELEISRESIARLIEVTGDPKARDILKPHLLLQTARLQRAYRVADASERLARAADVYRHDLDETASRMTANLQTLCSGPDPCATRYYVAGALHAAGRDTEALVWLRSVDADIARRKGSAGLAAQRVWERGLQLYVRGSFARAIAVFDAGISEDRDVAAFFDGIANTVRGEAIRELLFSRDAAVAFRYADPRSSLPDVQRALASSAAIVRYATFHDDVIAFVIRRDSIETVQLTATSRQIANAAMRMRRADDADFGAAASELHDLVFAPLREKLDGISTIAVVPNRDLMGLSFGALFDTARGVYLTDGFTIVHASSAAAAVTRSYRARLDRATTMLAIGATEFDRERHPDAEPLAGVRREVADIAAMSQCARVFSGAQATPGAIERQLAENAVIHYGGHIVKRGTELLLLLAPSGGRDTLSAREIATLRLEKARVVVLAACRGAAIGETLSLFPTMADAFLTAGVPSVIASAYDVDDAEAPATMRRLHSFLQDGEDAAEALRKTQLAELRAGRGVPLSIRFHTLGGTRGLVEPRGVAPDLQRPVVDSAILHFAAPAASGIARLLENEGLVVLGACSIGTATGDAAEALRQLAEFRAGHDGPPPIRFHPGGKSALVEPRGVAPDLQRPFRDIAILHFAGHAIRR